MISHIMKEKILFKIHRCWPKVSAIKTKYISDNNYSSSFIPSYIILHLILSAEMTTWSKVPNNMYSLQKPFEKDTNSREIVVNLKKQIS